MAMTLSATTPFPRADSKLVFKINNGPFPVQLCRNIETFFSVSLTQYIVSTYVCTVYVHTCTYRATLPPCGVAVELEYLGEFKSIPETALRYQLGEHVGDFDILKNRYATLIEELSQTQMKDRSSDYVVCFVH
jgi:hypothetical protein